MSNEEKPKDNKVTHERVVHEHPSDGKPHITIDSEKKTLNHYASGCPFARAAQEAKRSSHGPAQVASDRYRSNWDNINWGTGRSGKDLPS